MKRWGMWVPVAVLCLGMGGAVRAAEEAAKSTLDNLKTAYGQEVNAKARYEAFAVKADQEGYKSVSALFRAAADSEGIHVRKLTAALKKMDVSAKATMEKPEVKSTKENLEAAVKAWTSGLESLYPSFVRQADADKNSGAVMLFKSAMAADVDQAKFFDEALKNLEGWRDAGKIFGVCQVCGLTVMGPAPANCPICSAPRDKFKMFK